MNKAQLIEKIALDADITLACAKRVLNAFQHAVKEELAAGGAVELTGFGKFSVQTRAERTGHNPKTGDSLVIPECKVPRFKPGSAFKLAVK